MANFAFIKADGFIAYTSTANLSDYEDGATYGEYLCKLYPGTVTQLESIYYSRLQEGFYQIPNKPSAFHLWNSAEEQWELTEEQIQIAKNKKQNEVMGEMNSLSLQPIEYDSHALDADSTAIKNINGKLVELTAKAELNITIPVEQLFWRDADDDYITFTTASEYKEWLQRLAIAISERTSALYVIAWTKKAEVEALTDIDDIIAYDVNTGW